MIFQRFFKRREYVSGAWTYELWTVDALYRTSYGLTMHCINLYQIPTLSPTKHYDDKHNIIITLQAYET